MTSVALIGANGHGRWHRRRLLALPQVRLAGLADVQPIDPDPPSDAPVFTDHRAMLEAVRPDVVVICTPPHTHVPLALDALSFGCDLLLEKPPVPSPADHEVLAQAVSSAGRACQVGFQALGSAAWARFRDALPPQVSGVTAVASWQREDAYYARAPWAGKRSVAGRPVIDGALVNPLAHAVMQALATAAAAGAGRPVSLTVERYRVRDIEVDDTAFARITFDSGLPVLVAVTLAGEDFIAGEIGAGGAVLEYPTDRFKLPGSDFQEVPGRTDLLTNLIDHRRDGTPLLVPLAATADFTAVLAALTDLPVPHLLTGPEVRVEGPKRTLVGVNEVIRRAAETLSLPSEMDVPWAVKPQTAVPGA